MKASRSNWCLCLSLVLGAAVLSVGLPRPAFAQAREAEPNNTCNTAQDLGAVKFPVRLQGSLDTPPVVPDVDFFRITGAPQTFVRIESKGRGAVKTRLPDPLVGAFDSTCKLVDSNDDSDPELNAQLVLAFPADGVLIIAVTSYDDRTFEGLGFSGGAYELTLTATARPAPPGPAGSISGRAVDAVNQTPLPGDAFPFVVVKLYRCDNGNCDSASLLSTMPTDRHGRFRFDQQSVGARLTEGIYQVIAIGNQNFTGRTDLFAVSAGQQARIGDIPLVECITECLDAPAAQGGSR